MNTTNATQLLFPFSGPGVTDFNDPTLQEDFDKTLEELDKKLQPRIDAFRDSEHLTEADYALRITPCD